MLVFVAHQVAGVHLVPEEWLDGWRANGFREATPAEIACWYLERDMDPPPAGDGEAGAAGTIPEWPGYRAVVHEETQEVQEIHIQVHVHERLRE